VVDLPRLRHAGEPAAACAWADRAVGVLCEPLDASGAPLPEEAIARNRATAVSTLYVCGEPERALEPARVSAG
jgi:hypothetical protein